jgi:hypothetical protein
LGRSVLQMTDQPLVGLKRLRSLMCCTTHGLFGSPLRGIPACFHARLPCLEQPSPENLRPQFHPSLTLSPLQSTFVLPPARHLSTLRPYLPRVSSLLATSPATSTHHEAFHSLATFRPQAFSASRRFTPSSGFVGLFHPAATYRVFPVQGILSPCSHFPSSGEFCPLVVGERKLTGRGQLPSSNASTTRLCSTRSSVVYGLGLAAP